MKKYLRQAKFALVIYGVFSVFTYIFLSLIFASYSWITDASIKSDFHYAKIVTIQVLSLILSLLIFLIILCILKRFILYVVIKWLRNDVIKKIFSMNYNEFYKYSNIFYSSLIVNDIDILENSYYANLINIIEDLIQIIVTLCFIGFIDIKYVLIVFLLNIPSLIQPFLLKTKIQKAALNTSEAMTLYNDKTNEYIYGMEEIITTNNQEIFKNKFSEDVSKFEAVRYYEKHITLINITLIIIASYITKVGSLLFFVNDVVIGALAVAAATSLFGYSNNIGNPISSILGYYNELNAAKSIKKKIDEFLYNDTLKIDSCLDTKNKKIESITVKNLTYYYSENKILDRINYTFKKGGKYSIFGGSGSGKSTLLKLIMGFYNEYDGKIFYNNYELDVINTCWLWENIAYIQQETFMLTGTLRDNITLFSNKFSDEKIRSALELVGLEELVNSLTDGLDTLVEEEGSNFSGGEKQRIALARAILYDREILLLDESFSAIDKKSMMEIEKKILKLNKTIISISHRPNSNLYLYDQIMILKDGKIVESGKYKDLQNENTYFFKLTNNTNGGEIIEEE